MKIVFFDTFFYVKKLRKILPTLPRLCRADRVSGKLFFLLVGVCCFVYSSELIERNVATDEFIKKPKEKKEHVSEQQCLEMQADIVMASNKLAAESTRFQQEVLNVQKLKISRMNDYCDGQRVAKEQRIASYKHDLKLKQELESAYDDVRAARKRVKALSSH